MIVFGIAILALWTITGFIRFYIRACDEELPDTMPEALVSHLVEGPLSWIIGMGKILYWLMNKIEGLL